MLVSFTVVGWLSFLKLSVSFFFFLYEKEMWPFCVLRLFTHQLRKRWPRTLSAGTTLLKYFTIPYFNIACNIDFNIILRAYLQVFYLINTD